MTVCVGAINGRGEIVTASDHMLSMSNGAFTAEGAAIKDEGLTSHWRALYAAEDVGVVPSLLRRVEEQLGTWSGNISVARMTEVLRDAYQAERRARAVEQYLSPFGVGLEEFRAHGDDVIGDSNLAAVIRERIERHQLGCELLVCGHDGTDRELGLIRFGGRVG